LTFLAPFQARKFTLVTRLYNPKLATSTLECSFHRFSAGNGQQ
jgi:hypothetical protein